MVLVAAAGAERDGAASFVAPFEESFQELGPVEPLSRKTQQKKRMLALALAYWTVTV